MTEGRSKKISELTSVNSVSNSDILIVNSNASGNSITSKITVNNFIRSAISNTLFISETEGNNIVTAAGATPVAYFTYNRTVYSGVQLLFDMQDTANNKTFGLLRITANSTVANAQSGTGQHVHLGANPINAVANAAVSGNTVTLSLSQTGSTANITIRYIATQFKV